jgi:hypothetical protein
MANDTRSISDNAIVTIIVCTLFVAAMICGVTAMVCHHQNQQLRARYGYTYTYHTEERWGGDSTRTVERRDK